MAQSGSFSSTFSTGYTLRVDWAESGVDVATNTSDLTVTAYLVCAGSSTSGYYINSDYDKNISFTINGTTYSGICRIQCGRGETVQLFTKTVSDIAHNTDGTKSVSISCTTQIKATLNGKYVASASASGTATLSTIARASQPSCVTWPEHTKNVGCFGDTISIFMNRKSNTFTHTVRYEYGSLSGTIATGVTNDVSWTIPKSFMTLIPNVLSGSGTIYVDTYNGSTYIDTLSCGFTATVPTSDDCYPTCSLKLEVIGDAGTIYGKPVKGLTSVKITVNPTLAYGSPIDSCTITADGKTYSGLTAETGILTIPGASTITATVKDKRGRPCKTAASYTMDVLDYRPPSITSFDVHRCNSDGEENDQGDCFSVWLMAGYSLRFEGNAATYELMYKKSTETKWKTHATGNWAFITNSTEFIIEEASPDSSYDVKVVLTDRHDSVSKTTSVSTAFTLMNWNANGTGIAFGKVSEKSNTFECALTSEFGKTILPKGDCDIRPVSANRPTQGSGGLYTFKATSSMTEGKPPFDAHVLGFDWDNKGGWDAQFAIRASNGDLATRGMANGVWGEWANVITDRGGIITGPTYVKSHGSMGWFRPTNGWLGMYPSFDDAVNATNRKGWLGYDTGNILTIKDETGGMDFISKGSMRWAAGYVNVLKLETDRFMPLTDCGAWCGDSVHRWAGVYANVGTIYTSDRNQKKNIEEIDKRYIELFERLIPVSYMFKREGSDRTHIGFISQDVEAAMAEVGLTDLDFAGFCRDIKTEPIEVIDTDNPIYDEEGNPVLDKGGNPTYKTKTEDRQVLDENGDPVYVYSLRYEEFIALNTKMIQLTRKETASLRAELDELKQLVLNKL